MQTYRFDKKTKEFLYAETAYLDPLETEQQGKDVYLLPANSTFDTPPTAKPGYAVMWNGATWELVEDHRRKLDKSGTPIENTGTSFWMPGDTWQTPARYMKELGKLPEGAMLEKPEKPQDVILKELEEQYTSFVQHILDVEAQKLGYDNCNSVCTYVETGVQKFDDEGIAFRKWRSAVWTRGYEILANVQSGKMEIPTEEELIKLLPALEIIYTVIE